MVTCVLMVAALILVSSVILFHNLAVFYHKGVISNQNMVLFSQICVFLRFFPPNLLKFFPNLKEEIHVASQFILGEILKGVRVFSLRVDVTVKECR